jgi:hypothetical protein
MPADAPLQKAKAAKMAYALLVILYPVSKGQVVAES